MGCDDLHLLAAGIFPTETWPSDILQTCFGGGEGRVAQTCLPFFYDDGGGDVSDDGAVYWVSIGHYEAVAVGNWGYWVSRGHSCLYTLQKVEIWTGVTDAWVTDWLTHKER